MCIWQKESTDELIINPSLQTLLLFRFDLFFIVTEVRQIEHNWSLNL